MEVLDEPREPAPVCDRLQVYLSRLRSGYVDSQELVFRKQASKRFHRYTQGTHTLSALLRYRANGIEKNPGQDVSYVVVDEVRLPDLVRLPFETFNGYDEDVYARELVRAAESIVRAARMGARRHQAVSAGPHRRVAVGVRVRDVTGPFLVFWRL